MKIKKIISTMLIFTIVLTSCTKQTVQDKYVKQEFTYEQLMKNVENPRKLEKLEKPISDSDATMMYTLSEITLYDYGDRQLIDECFSLIKYYEGILSSNAEKAETSDIYKLNNSKGETIQISDNALECLNYGYEYSKNSFETFDITIGALTSLWNFREAVIAPKQQDIDTALKTVDYNNLHIDGNNVSLSNSDTKIDLGAISKGFIADKVAYYLKSQGVNSAIIYLGGNIYAVGYKNNTTNENFKVGIREPKQNSSGQIGYVEVNNISMVSSGDYEQFFTDVNTGITYSHILDKKTGYPAETDIAQVTIFSEKSVDGDGLSTTAYSLGSEKGLELIESLPNTECIIVKKDGAIIFSSGVGEDEGKKIKFVSFK